MISETLLAAWLLAAMLRWLPVEAPVDLARYQSIADDTAAVALDPWEAPLYPGRHGRARTALQLLAVQRFEGEFTEAVDEGRKRGRAGDVCGMQIVVPRGKRMLLTADLYRWLSPQQTGYEEAWTAEDLVPGSVPGRRENCVRAGLHMLRESLRACRSLSLYTRGDCQPDAKARHREALARESIRRYPPPEAP